MWFDSHALSIEASQKPAFFRNNCRSYRKWFPPERSDSQGSMQFCREKLSLPPSRHLSAFRKPTRKLKRVARNDKNSLAPRSPASNLSTQRPTLTVGTLIATRI